MALINIPLTPPVGASNTTLNAYVALATAQQALNTAITTVANSIQADQAAAAQAALSNNSGS